MKNRDIATEIARLQASISLKTAKERDRITELELERESNLKKYSSVKCKYCGKIHLCRNTVLYEAHGYESPYGCTDGDEWWFYGYEFRCDDCGRETKTYYPKGQYFKETKKRY